MNTLKDFHDAYIAQGTRVIIVLGKGRYRFRYFGKLWRSRAFDIKGCIWLLDKSKLTT